MSTTMRALVIRLAGLFIILLAFGSALLPLSQTIPPRIVIGLLLTAAGASELVAVFARRGRHVAAAVAAGATLVAGIRLVLDSSANFFTVLNLVILWLVVRSAAHVFAARGSDKPLCYWIYISAAVDFLLAVLLLAGLPVAVLVYGLFGQVSAIVATFAWVFAASFIAAGLLLVIAAPADARDPR